MRYLTRAYETKAKVLDEEQGIVECYVNTLDAVDYAGDVMPSGIFDRALQTKGKLPYLEGIDHQGIAGRTLETKQIGDQQYAKVKFNLKTREGHDAYWHVAEGDVSEWSVKWETLDRHFETKNGERVRVLDKIDWIAFGPVIEGASKSTSTLSVKGKGDLICPFCHPKSAVKSTDESDCTCDDDCGEGKCPMAEDANEAAGRRRRLERKDAPEGSYQDTTEDLLRTLTAPGGFLGGQYVTAFATYDDHMVVCVYSYLTDGRDYFLVPYTMGADGEPVPAKPIAAVLQVVPANPQEAAELGLDLGGDLESATRRARGTTAPQTKAGRRNSGADSQAVQKAHDLLLEAHPETECSPDNMPGRKRRDREEVEELKDRLRFLDLNDLSA